MGLSGPVAAVILVTALLAQGSTLFTAQRNADALVAGAREGWQRRAVAEGGHGLAVVDAAWDGAALRLNLTLNNTGTVTLDAGRLDVLLDGAWSTSSITARLVDGASTGVWPPAKLLNLTVTAGSKPTDAVVVSPWGQLAARRGL